MTIEDIAGKLATFHEQIHQIHWETRSFAEHKALGDFYDFLQDFKDEIVEKIMGYSGKRIKGFRVELIKANENSIDWVDQVLMFANELEMFGDVNRHPDVCNMAQALSGEAAKVKYLLTLS